MLVGHPNQLQYNHLQNAFPMFVLRLSKIFMFFVIWFLFFFFFLPGSYCVPRNHSKPIYDRPKEQFFSSSCTRGGGGPSTPPLPFFFYSPPPFPTSLSCQIPPPSSDEEGGGEGRSCARHMLSCSSQSTCHPAVAVETTL